MIIGKDGVVYEGRGPRRVESDDVRPFDNFSDYLGKLPFPDEHLKTWARAIEERHAYLANKGIPYVFAIAPTKAMIYPEKLPSLFQASQRPITRYDELYTYLKENTRVPIADLREALLRAKAQHSYPDLYYRIDFHWNFFGAFFAYREIVKVANEHYPELGLTPLEISDFEIDVDEGWIDYPSLHALGLKPYRHHTDDYVRLKPKSMDRFPQNGILTERGIEDVRLPEETNTRRNNSTYRIKTLRNPNGEKPMIVVYGDSFIHKTLLYFSAHAERLVFKRAVFKFPMDIIENDTPDLFVQEILNMYILNDPVENPKRIKTATAGLISSQ